jgi:glycosyltransferase involved in cell wall biosynthesis
MITSSHTPILSIVVPHLNEPSNLRRCLASLDRQRADGVHLEIVVADNGSVQVPTEVCAEFDHVMLVVEPTPGPGPARNAGAAIARADLIAFIDADCVAQPGWARALVDYFTDHSEIDFVGGSIGVLPTGQRMTAVEAFESVFSYRTAMLVQEQHFAPTGNMAVRKSCFQAVGPFAGIARHEDRIWGHKAVGMGMRLAYVPSARILTQGCTNYGALARRTDIQLAHDRADLASGIIPRLRWLLLAGMVAGSALFQGMSILRSPEIRNSTERLCAWRCLAAIRIYRAKRMVELMFDDWSGSQLQSWNRTEPPSST